VPPVPPVPPADAPPAPKLVGALASGLSVLRYLGRSRSPVGVTRIARDLELNASTCFNLLRTLVHEGLVCFDEATKTYAIGLGLVELARGALDRASFVRLLLPHLDTLAERHAATLVLWQRSPGERLMLVHVAENPAAVRVQMSVGARLPLFAGASGRCMAAFCGMTRSEIRSRCNAVRWDRAPSFERYWASVLQVRELGYAVDEGEYQQGVTIVGVPVFDRDRRPAMTIGAASFSAQLDADRLAGMSRDLIGLAARATRALAGPDAGVAPPA
jgi:DNA-binding IclR family transcriptional regulator